ncbi:LacI family DNA-binding transcriptional regulator [Granulosicoccus sp. 3-233]|uniref:LacI family DNA-binding transcriptional regulator n=1 Tax=Granulosicoccus sp. 3-233 TaxID=3417969 RepID=UPI003D340977
MSKPTLQDVASRAGVSMATVDRVLHARDGVSERARRNVAEAVRALGFGRLDGIEVGKVRDSMRFAFLLPEHDTGSGFTKAMHAAVEHSPAAVMDVDVLPQVHELPVGDGQAVAAALDALDPREVDGAAVFAVDTPGVRQAINAAVDRGIPVVTLVTDIQGSRRQRYVGVDNLSAGRVAGTLLGRFAGERQGPVALVTGPRRQRDQLERQLGFEQVIEERFAGLKVLPVVQGDARGDVNRKLAIKLLERHEDLVGIYSLAAGNASLLEGLSDGMAASGAERRQPLFIAHELSPAMRAGLLDGRVDAILAQSIDHIARSAVRVLRACSTNANIIDSQERIRIDVYFADNLP